MARDSNNVVPVSLSVLLHLVIFASMIFGVNMARPIQPPNLIVKATLVEEIPDSPPQVRQPEPEPVVEEPLPEPEPDPEPDNSDELRRQAEAEKLRQDALLEQQRLEEQRQREEAERRQKEREEAERQQREEEERERRRVEAERQRQEDIRRQREENERIRREIEAEERANAIAAEERVRAENNSPEMTVYQTMIRQRIFRNWSVPASMGDDVECVAHVRQARGGDVIGVRIGRCNGDEAVQRSIEAAIRRASPLPDPPTPNLFRADLVLNMTKQAD